MLFSSVLPTVQFLLQSRQYTLSPDVKALVGAPNNNLASKIAYQAASDSWQFNADGIPIGDGVQSASMPSLNNLKAQIGGGGEKDDSLYAVDMPTSGKKGVTYYDTNTNLSFTLVPTFQVGDGKQVEGHLVYPSEKGSQLIYTAKTNGMKEDIILPKSIGDTAEFTYKLELPDTLEAKIQDDGSLGIFSPNPVLFGKISDDQDQEKILSARKTAAKDHLLFVLPAPVIVEKGGKQTNVPARFVLTGNTLTIKAEQLQGLSYPISIDPSVAVTSSSDFATGSGDNIEWGIDLVRRSAVTGGSVNDWALGTNSIFKATVGTAVYNGYIYSVGSNDSNAATVQYAPLNSNGSIGTWSATTTMPTGRAYPAVVPYNGKLYVYGGYESGTSALSSVIYATINSDGTLGDWTAASNSMANAVCRFGWTGADGYLYAAGGATGTVASNCNNSSATMLNSVQYAQILPNGDVGPWTTSSSTFTNARKDPGFAIYNGYAYMTSGTLNGATNYRDTQIAKIEANGDIGTWRTSSHQTAAGMYRFGYQAYGGYLYLTGGTNNLQGTLYAQILTNGDIGPWASSATMQKERWGHGFVVYKGYMYSVNGSDSVSNTNTSEYAKIDPPGIASTSSSTTALGASIDTGAGGAGFTYNGYVYYIGGYTGTTNSTQVRYASINSDGTLGTWNTTTPVAAPIAGASGIANTAFAIYNNRIYLIGGQTTSGGSTVNVATVQYASFNTNGTLSAWSFTTSYDNIFANHGAAAYNGFMYVRAYSGGGATNRIYRAPINEDGTLGSWTWINSSNLMPTSVVLTPLVVYGNYLYSVGGSDNTNYLGIVQYAPINSDGSLGTWATTNAMPTSRIRHKVITVNGYMYAIGGQTTAAGDYTNVVEYAKINSDGTLDQWQTSANLTVTVSDGGVAAWNDTIYIISGRNNGTRVKNVLTVKVRSGGGGSNTAWTTSGNTFTAGRQNHGSVIYNSHLYVIGGLTNSTTRTDSVQYAKLGNDGSVGSWSSATSLPVARDGMGVVAYKGYLFVFGGRLDASNVSSTSYSAPINNDGTLGSWTTIDALNDQNSAMATVEHNGYVYLLGGSKTATPFDTVRFAKLNDDGTTGTWASTTAFSGGRYQAGAVVNGNYIYILGGTNGAGTSYKDVQSALINNDGTVGSWNRTTDMNHARSYIAPTIMNGYVYVYGGFDGTTTYNKVEYAPLSATGAVGNWYSGITHTNVRYGHTVNIYNGYAYLSGGYGGGTYYSNVQSSPLQSMARIGHYSKLIDLGASSKINGVMYDGTIPGGIASISYRTAGDNGIFGTAKNADESPQEPATVCTGSYGNGRYVLINIVLDDTAAAVLPDTERATLSSITVSYSPTRPAPDVRLHGGKTLIDGNQSALDTCGN